VIHLIWNSSPSFRLISEPVLSESRKVQPLEAADSNRGHGPIARDWRDKVSHFDLILAMMLKATPESGHPF
jgi:hypothetical protein